MITHILKDGTILDDISGHKVTREDAPTVYEILEQLKKQRRESNDRDNGHIKHQGMA